MNSKHFQENAIGLVMFLILGAVVFWCINTRHYGWAVVGFLTISQTSYWALLFISGRESPKDPDTIFRMGAGIVIVVHVIVGWKTGHIGWTVLSFFAIVLAFYWWMTNHYPEAFWKPPELYYPTTPQTIHIRIQRPLDSVWGALMTIETWTAFWPDLKGVSPGWGKGAVLEWSGGGTSKVTVFKRKRKIMISNATHSFALTLWPRGEATYVRLQEAPINDTRWSDCGFRRLPEMHRILERLKGIVEV